MLVADLQKLLDLPGSRIEIKRVSSGVSIEVTTQDATGDQRCGLAGASIELVAAELARAMVAQG
jgi:hypothetical protein